MSEADDDKFWPVVLGTLVFAGLGVGSCMFGQALRFKGVFSRGEASLASFFIMLSVVCMWMQWVMTWLAQVNPILYPVVDRHNDTDDH